MLNRNFPENVWMPTTNACPKKLYCWNRMIVSKKAKQQPQQYTGIKQ